ncbi:MAG: hypothetical protein HY237_06340 [Acidobacteria bacterium]|nr:hypothetical protein [Acidobacteriota bacterium]
MAFNDMRVPFAIVQHANPFLIKKGYDHRHGLRATLGSVESKSGLAWILELHRIYDIPANLHFSGTLLEAIAWQQPAFLRGLCRQPKAQLLGWAATRQELSKAGGNARPRRTLPWELGSLAARGAFCGHTKRG